MVKHPTRIILLFLQTKFKKSTCKRNTINPPTSTGFRVLSHEILTRIFLIRIEGKQ